MDLSWLFKNFLSKSEFYSGVLSLAIALSATYFNFTSIPWMLVLLYCFLFFSLLTFAYRRYHAYIKKTKEKKKKEQENITQQKGIERLIELAFIDMNILGTRRFVFR